MNKNEKFDWADAEEIASSVCGLKDDAESDEIETALYEKYEISFEQYQKVVEDLFARIDFGISPLTQNAFVGFSNKEKGMWLVKKDVSNQFVNAVISWMTGDEKIKKGKKGFSRTITKGGKPEFEIIIKRPRKKFKKKK